MSVRSRLASFFRNVLHRERAEQALDDELASYVEMLVDEKMRTGLGPVEARRSAMLEMGGTTQVKENVRRIRTGAMLDTLQTDFRYALRSLARNRGFTVTAVICLALGIGANTAIFTVLDTVLHPRFGFVATDELVVLRSSRPTHGIPSQNVSYPDFIAWREQSTSFSGVAAIGTRSTTVMTRDEPIQARAGIVSWDLFDVLGVRPAFGRDFRPDEDQRGAPGAVLLGHELWTQRFAADSAVLGTRIEINGEQHTVVGVMPERFRFPENTALWMPLARVPNDSSRGTRDLTVIARLGPGVSRERATSELRTVAARLATEFPGTNSAWTARIITLRDHLGSEEGLLAALAMMGAVTFVLLIACTNVANLMLVRGAARRREIAIRSALGAGRRRTIGMLLVESATLGLVGGTLGVAVALTFLRLLDAALPATSIPYYIDWRIDGRALAYMLSLSLGTAMAFGLAPAILVSGGDLQQPLRNGSRESDGGRRPGRFRASLVVIEVALSLILVVGAALFVRTSTNLANVDPGFDTAPILSLRVDLPGPRYADEAARTRLVDEVIARIEAIPGVHTAAASYPGAVEGSFFGGGTVEPFPAGAAAPVPDVRWNPLTSNWFGTFGVPIVRGRTFTPREGRERTAVAVINQTMASRAWPNVDPIGQRFRFTGDTTLPLLTVIGVAPDVRGMRPRGRQEAFVFLPYPYGTSRTIAVAVRAADGDPLQLVPAVRRAIREADAALPVFDVQPMDAVRRLAYAETTVLGGIFSTFGLIALCLAAIGVYGVISYGVTQRAHEIGVRMALGARRVDVSLMFVRQGLGLTTVGILIGLAGAFTLTRFVRGMLFGISATDPASFIAGTVLLLSVAAAATWIPTWRTASPDPARVLRAE